MEEKDFSEMTLEELKNVQEEVKEAIAVAKADAKAKAAGEKEERAEKFKNELNPGDYVSFLYGRDNTLCEGTVIRTSEKSATVESDYFSKGKNYVRFDRFVEVLEAAEIPEADTDVA